MSILVSLFRLPSFLKADVADKVYRALFLFVLSYILFIPGPVLALEGSSIESVRKASRLTTIAQEMKYLDEILTTSVLAYAFTKDRKWLNRYQEHEPKLAAIFEEMMSHKHSSDLEVINRINIANDQLISLETEAIELTNDGRVGEALNVLNSDPYTYNKKVYALALAEFFSNVEARFTEELTNGKKVKPVELTEKEQAWVRDHTVKVGIEEWPPIVFAAKDGRAGGLAGAYLQMLAQRTGLKFEIVADAWDPLLNGLRGRTIDLLPATYYTDERATYGLYSKPYFLMKEFVYVRSENKTVKSLDDLAYGKIAVVKGYGTIPKLKEYLPKATIVETKDQLASINAVLNGEVDALVEAQMAVQQVLRLNSIVGLKGVSQNAFPSSPIHLFSRIDEPVLQSILQKGMDSITEEQRRAAQSKWLHLDEGGKKQVELTLDEEQWLSSHSKIRVGDDFAWPPFTFRDEQGAFSGIGAGYFEVISERLGIDLEPVWDLTWTEVIEKVKSGDLDLLPAVARTPKREKFLNFTKPYISFPVVIATRKDGLFVDNLADLEGLKVGVVAGYITQELLVKEHPKLTLVTTKNLAEGLAALQEKRVDAFVDNLGSITYLLDEQGIEDIKIAAPTDYRFELSIGVRKDWPELVAILDKALDSIDDRERTAIKNAWMAIQVEFGMDLKTILIWAVPIGGGAILIIFFVVVWNRKMGREIDQRKKAQLELTAIHDELTNKEAQLRLAMDNMPGGMLLVDSDQNFVLFNHQYSELFDFPDDLIAEEKPLLDMFHFQTQRGDFGDGRFVKIVDEMMRIFKSKKHQNYERHLKNGRILEINLAPTPDGGTVSVATDVTERKRAEKALRENEEQLAAILDASPVGVSIVGEDGKRKYVNTRISEMIGRPREDLVGADSVSSFVDADVQDRLRATFASQGRVRDFEAEFMRADGTPYWVLVSMEPTKYKGDSARIAWVYDITERKEAEQKVKESEAQLQAMADNIPAVMTMKDTEGRYVFANKVFEEWNCKERGEVIGNSMYDIHPPEFASVIEAGDRQVHESREPLTRHMEREYPDGVTRAVIYTRFPVLTPEGKLLGIGTVNHDITELKRAEEQLAAILDASPVGVTIAGEDGKRKYVNSRISEMIGRRKEDLIGADSVTSFTDAAVQEQMRAAFADEGRVRDFEAEFVRADGTPYWVLVTMEPTEYKGEPARIAWVYDITERKVAEKAVRESEVQLQAILDNIPSFITVKDTEGRFIFVNKVFEEWNCKERGEVIGQTLYDVHSPELAAEFEARDQKILENREPVIRQIEREYLDGKTRVSINTRFPLLTPEGEILGMGIVNHDITELKRAEEKIANAMELINDSISYASRIQRSTLPTQHLLDLAFSDKFVIWEPRDVVGGDIYWLLPVKDGYVLGVADCTGHGVPGAFLTLVATSALRFAIAENPDATPAQLIASMNYFVKDVLAQHTEDTISDDGLELGICRIDTNSQSMSFSGARFSLWVLAGGEIQEVKGDKTGIGYTNVPVRLEVENHSIERVEGASYYMFSDGFNDQVGGQRGRGFGKRRLLDQLVQHEHNPMAAQREAILKTFVEYQGDEIRRDDLSMVGFRL